MNTANGEGANLDRILKIVRHLIIQAEHEGTGPAEAQQFRAKADELMLKYAIQKAQIRMAQPEAHRTEPMIIDVELGDGYLLGYIIELMRAVARHTRCISRSYTSWHDGAWWAKVYGFEHDVRYFEMLYTTLRLHMLGALMPRINTHETLEENAYRLHNAGYNWLEIAEMYGWQKQDAELYPDIKVPFRNKHSEEVQPATMVGSRIKRAYYRHIKAIGEDRLSIPASRSKIYRESAARGYTSRISQRMREIETGRGTGHALVLAGGIQDLHEFFKRQNPDLFPTDEEIKAAEEAIKNGPKPRGRPRTVFKDPPFDNGAYQVGKRHADTADLNGPKMGQPKTKRISSK